MCLHSLDLKPPKESGVGWQVLEQHGPGVYGAAVMPKSQKFKTGEEGHAGPQNVSITSVEFLDPYPQGFHIFEKRDMAEAYLKLFAKTLEGRNYGVVIRKVQYRGAHTRGIAIFSAKDSMLGNYHAAVVVAEYRTILAEEKQVEYTGVMDPEVTALCDALNRFQGIETISSCCGNGRDNFRIWFHADDLISLPTLVYFFSACHGAGQGWSVRATTDCAMSPIHFMLEGPTNTDAAETIADNIRKYLDGKNENH